MPAKKQSYRHVAPKKTKHRKWVFPKLIAFGSIIIILGAGLALYPHAASWFSQYNQSRLITAVAGEQKQVTDKHVDERIAEAREYNRLLVGGVIVEANQHKASGNVKSEGEFDYYSLLNATDSGIMGRLRIKSIDVDLPIYHGTSDLTLTKGVGHLRGTALPVGGKSTRSVLTAHRGYPEATLFDNLDKVKVGDTFVIEVFGEVLTYRVINTKVINPDDTESISVVDGKDLVSLITCTPLGINSHRILVTGERVLPTPTDDVAAAGETPDIPGFPWWAVIAVAVLLGVALLIWRAGYTEARRRSKAQARAKVDDAPAEE